MFFYVCKLTVFFLCNLTISFLFQCVMCIMCTRNTYINTNPVEKYQHANPILRTQTHINAKLIKNYNIRNKNIKNQTRKTGKHGISLALNVYVGTLLCVILCVYMFIIVRVLLFLYLFIGVLPWNTYTDTQVNVVNKSLIV